MDLTELYEERAAIREFDGGYPRHEAERLAYFDLCKLVGKKQIPQEIISKLRMDLETQGRLF